MNMYEALQMRDAEGNSGLWHYTVTNDDRTLPVGYCAQNCPGHATPDEAREHYRLYLLDHATYDGFLNDEQRRCERCGKWTQHYASIPINMERHILCDEHCNRETLDVVMHRVGQAVGS